MFRTTITAALVLFGGLAGEAVAQPPYGSQPPARPDLAQRGRQTYRARDILGAQIRLRDGYSVGTVSDMVFSDAGVLDYLVVETNGRNVLVPWSAARFDLPARAATLDVPRDRWRDAPAFPPDRWPDVRDPGYRARISGYYGMPAAPLQPARDARTLFVFDDADGYYQDQGNGTWARYQNGRFDRAYRETARTPDFIELAGQDDSGNPVQDRLYNTFVDWKLAASPQWNRAHAGHWRTR